VKNWLSPGDIRLAGYTVTCLHLNLSRGNPARAQILASTICTHKTSSDSPKSTPQPSSDRRDVHELNNASESLYRVSLTLNPTGLTTTRLHVLRSSLDYSFHQMRVLESSRMLPIRAVNASIQLLRIFSNPETSVIIRSQR